MRRARKHKEAVDLEVTPFISLLVVLVPFLLVSLVFSHITILDLKLPDAAGGGAGDPNQNMEVELVIRPDHLEIHYPRGTLVKTIPDKAVNAHDFELLSLTLQEVKRQLREKTIEKKSITILSEQDTPYQTIISAMDTVRSFKTVVAASVVNAELFPEISFGDAPQAPDQTAMAGATR
jgi:biopolymer transport protein ExbD